MLLYLDRLKPFVKRHHIFLNFNIENIYFNI